MYFCDSLKSLSFSAFRDSQISRDVSRVPTRITRRHSLCSNEGLREYYIIGQIMKTFSPTPHPMLGAHARFYEVRAQHEVVCASK